MAAEAAEAESTEANSAQDAITLLGGGGSVGAPPCLELDDVMERDAPPSLAFPSSPSIVQRLKKRLRACVLWWALSLTRISDLVEFARSRSTKSVPSSAMGRRLRITRWTLRWARSAFTSS